MAKNSGTKTLADGTSTSGDGFDAAHGNGSLPLFQRAVIHEVLFDPASLSDDRVEELSAIVRFNANVRNLPRNTVLGERIRTGHTEISGKELFFPFYSPHLALPIKPGEQVWVFFEDPGMVDTQGFWMSRVSEVRSADDINHTHPDRKFDKRASKKTSDKSSGAPAPVPSFNNGLIGQLDGTDVNLKGTASIGGGPDAYKNIVAKPDNTKVHDYEHVPRFTKRPGDFVAQGSNNALLVLGTDRTGGVIRTDADSQNDAGTAIISVGRGRKPKTSGKKIQNSLGRDETDKSTTGEALQEGDIDAENDSAVLVVSMKTSADTNFKIKHAKLTDTSTKTSSAAIIKADQIRFIARQDIKLLVKASESTPDSEAAMIVMKASGDIVFIPSAKGVLKLGGDDADLAVLCTRVGVVNAGGKVVASPIISTMGGIVGGSDGLNGIMASKILVK